LKTEKGHGLKMNILPNQDSEQFPKEYFHNGITSVHLFTPQEDKLLPRGLLT
jgi:hypothetical protein